MNINSKTDNVNENIDETHLVDTSMPDEWRCPHCLKKNHAGPEADYILLHYGKYIEHCEHCGYLHLWTLKLTEKFKKEAIDHLMKWATDEEPPKLKKKYIEI